VGGRKAEAVMDLPERSQSISFEHNWEHFSGPSS
jgi:hypothetical protein